MSVKRLVITGVSSFTGTHIAHALNNAGFEVHAFTAGSTKQYDDLKKRRMRFSKVAYVHEYLEFGSENFLVKLHELKPHIFVNHGAWMEGYRNADFDYSKAFSKGTLNAKKVFEALSAIGCNRFIHTGSFFEPGEGDPNLAAESPAVSIYGVTKAAVWLVLAHWARYYKVPFSKIIIPNPIGPFENDDRLCPVFVKMWKDGKTPELRVCSAIRDNLPAPWLANVYVQEANRGDAQALIRRPSGFVLKQSEFVEMFAKEFSKELSIATPVNYNETIPDSLRVRKNTEPVEELNNFAVVKEFWKEWAQSFP